MKLNADFSKRVLIHSTKQPWQASPMPGVERRMLDRLGDEVARATSIVRYAPGSTFSAHTHGGGEEFIVLEGVFQDEFGDYPAGTYVRNPPTSRHTPGSEDGCTIFVKLWQFDENDRQRCCKNMMTQLGTRNDGVVTAELHRDERETVTHHTMDAKAELSIDIPGGIELLVLAGSLDTGGDHLARHAWLRLPNGQSLHAHAGDDGVQLWMKTGHLPYAKAPPI